MMRDSEVIQQLENAPFWTPALILHWKLLPA